MRRFTVAGLVSLVALAALLGFSSLAADKLPKCSGKLCRDAGCPADVLCVSGAHVKTCAEVCSGK